MDLWLVWPTCCIESNCSKITRSVSPSNLTSRSLISATRSTIHQTDDPSWTAGGKRMERKWRSCDFTNQRRQLQDCSRWLWTDTSERSSSSAFRRSVVESSTPASRNEMPGNSPHTPFRPPLRAPTISSNTMNRLRAQLSSGSLPPTSPPLQSIPDQPKNKNRTGLHDIWPSPQHQNLPPLTHSFDDRNMMESGKYEKAGLSLDHKTIASKSLLSSGITSRSLLDFSL